MGRIKFRKGFQRKFFERVLFETNAPSLRELSRRLNVNYSTLKNYFVEERLISGELFENLLKISGIKKEILKFEILNENWGKVKGGKIGKRE